MDGGRPAWAMCAIGAGRWAGTLSWRSTKNGWFGLVCAWDRRVSRSGDAAGLASPDLERLCRSGGAGPRFRTRVGGCSAQTCPAPLANRAGSRRRGFIGSAAMQRLLAIASAFDLSGAPIGNWSNSSSLVRRRPAVRVRPWAPNSGAPGSVFRLTSSGCPDTTRSKVSISHVDVAAYTTRHHKASSNIKGSPGMVPVHWS